jgi:predicted Zn-dependent peptidase
LESPHPGSRFIELVSKEVEQVQICLGVPGISYHSEERYTQNVLNSILGGGMSSRLFQSLRENAGWPTPFTATPPATRIAVFTLYI